MGNTSSNEKERLVLCISRFDHYYDSINNKGAVFLGIGTFVVGGLLALFPYLEQKVCFTFWPKFLLIDTILLGLAGIIITILATTPFLVRKVSSQYYFGSIAEMSLLDFGTTSRKFSHNDELDDLRAQVHGLAHGLQSKFQKLRLVALLYVIQFSLFIPLILTLIPNFK